MRTPWIHFAVADVTCSHATLVTQVDIATHRGMTLSGPPSQRVYCTTLGEHVTLGDMRALVDAGKRPRVLADNLVG